MRTKYSRRLQVNYVLAVEAENTSMSKQIKFHPVVLYAVETKQAKGRGGTKTRVIIYVE